MPWNQAQKKVIRDNSRNTGTTIWDLDAQATQPIDALGHDFHDQDLAGAISETLHIGGYNAMIANLDVGGNKLVGVAAGTLTSDGVNKSQMDAADGNLQGQITANDGELENHETRIQALEGSQGVPDPLTIGTLTVTVSATLEAAQLTSAMAAGGHKITGLGAGTAGTDAVNKTQLDAVQASADANAQNITDLKNGTDTATILRTREMNFQNLPTVETGTHTLNLDAGNRQYIVVTGALTVNVAYSALGTGVFGGDYVIETVVLFKNTAGAAITLNVAAGEVLGAPNTTAGSRSILTCLVFFDNNVEQDRVFVWSAESA